MPPVPVSRLHLPRRAPAPPPCPRPPAAKLNVLVKRARQAKEGAEAALSAKLGRRINIMGEINQLLG